MNRRTRRTDTFLLHLAGLVSLVAWPIAAAQDPPPSSAVESPEKETTAARADAQRDRQVEAARRSPRATMATFLNAVDDAEQGQIERYADALACLDLSGLTDLPEDARAPQGRKLASLLNAFIDKRGIELDLIPDDPDGTSYTYHDTPDGMPAIRITRNEEGVWRFTRDSLAFVESLPPEPVPEETAPPSAEPSPAGPAQAAPAPAKAPSKVPPEFRSARAVMRTFRKAIQEGRIDEAGLCLDLTAYPLVIRSEKGAECASLLHEAIKRTRVVVPQELPDDPDHARPFILYEDAAGIIVIARQQEGDDRPGHWLFTKETARGLDNLYEALLRSGARSLEEDETGATLLSSLWIREHAPDWLRGTWFLLKHWQWLGLAVLAAVGWIARRLTTFLLRCATHLWLRRQGMEVAEAVQVSPLKPAGILVAAGIWYWGLKQLSLRADVLTVLLAAVKFVACWAAVWTVYRAVDLLCDYFASLAEKTHTKMDDLLVPLVRKVAKILVTVFGVVFIVQQFTENRIPELLAGLGLGGLALALAAQDTLKNVFGSLTVIVDRPFKVGDWVLIGDIEGTIESVGFRSTRVRTFYNSQVVVPNATLMSATIDNYGARRYRRIRVMLSLIYSTPPEKIDAFCEGVRELIRLHPYTRKDYYHVYFNKFSGSSLDVLLYCFLETPDWGTELRERHRLFLDILRLAQRLGVDFAFPTQTLWLGRTRAADEDRDRSRITSEQHDPDAVGFRHAAEVFEEAYGPTPPLREPVVIDRTPRSARSGETK